MDENLTRLVRISYGTCLRNKHFFDDFYNRFLESDPAIRQKFAGTKMDRQKELMLHAVNIMISFASGKHTAVKAVKRIRESHNGPLDIRPHLYQLWKQSLMETVRENDVSADDKVLAAWDQVLQYGIDFILTGQK